MAVTAEIAPRVSAGIAARTVSTAGVGGDATGIGGSGALRYSITSSAVANSVSGMVRPRALAVLRLMMRS